MAMAKDELTTGSAQREGSLPSVEGVAAPHAPLARWTVAWFVHFIIFGGGEPWSVSPCFIWEAVAAR